MLDVTLFIYGNNRVSTIAPRRMNVLLRIYIKIFPILECKQKLNDERRHSVPWLRVHRDPVHMNTIK